MEKVQLIRKKSSWFCNFCTPTRLFQPPWLLERWEYSLSIYDKRLFQLIWQGSGASNSEINIFILIFFIFAQWPVLMYNPCIVLSMYLNRIVNLLTLTRANFDLGNSLTCFEKVQIMKSFGKLFYYRKVTSTNTSQLEAHFRFYRLFMKGKFDVYFHRTFKKKSIS